MKIALAQMACKPGDVAANLQTMRALCRRADAAGAGAVVFPEMADTGYHMPTILQTASPAEGAPRRALAETAAELGLWLVAGLSLREGGRVFNTAVAFSPDGEVVAEYRKIHLFSGEPVREHAFLAAGKATCRFRLGDFHAGLMICYDVRFPEMARFLAVEGAEMLLIPSAWPSPRIGHWSALLAARAIENQCYVLGVNRVGTDEGLEMGGTSAALDPFGVELARGDVNEQKLYVVEATPARLRDVRRDFPFLQDRRLPSGG